MRQKLQKSIDDAFLDVSIPNLDYGTLLPDKTSAYRVSETHNDRGGGAGRQVRLGSPHHGKKRARSATPQSDSNESNASWDDNDGLQTFSTMIESRLEDLPSHDLLVTKLSCHQRHTLHAQAHMRRLNHMSFGNKSSRCIIMSRDIISMGSMQPKTARLFREKAAADRILSLLRVKAVVVQDPATSTLQLAAIELRQMGPTELSSVLQRYGLPSPFYQTSGGMTFNSLDKVAEVCTSLHGLSLDCGMLAIQFERLNISTASTSSPLAGPIQNPTADFQPPFSNDFGPIVDVSDYSTRAGYTGTDDSTLPTFFAPGTKRYKRMPKTEGGYPCQHQVCGKVFDRAGHLKKHQAVHRPDEEQEYRCEWCGKGFLYPKDLRRHVGVHRRSNSGFSILRPPNIHDNQHTAQGSSKQRQPSASRLESQPNQQPPPSSAPPQFLHDRNTSGAATDVPQSEAPIRPETEHNLTVGQTVTEDLAEFVRSVIADDELATSFALSEQQNSS